MTPLHLANSSELRLDNIVLAANEHLNVAITFEVPDPSAILYKLKDAVPIRQLHTPVAGGSLELYGNVSFGIQVEPTVDPSGNMRRAAPGNRPENSIHTDRYGIYPNPTSQSINIVSSE